MSWTSFTKAQKLRKYCYQNKETNNTCRNSPLPLWKLRQPQQLITRRVRRVPLGTKPGEKTHQSATGADNSTGHDHDGEQKRRVRLTTPQEIPDMCTFTSIKQTLRRIRTQAIVSNGKVKQS